MKRKYIGKIISNEITVTSINDEYNKLYSDLIKKKQPKFVTLYKLRQSGEMEEGAKKLNLYRILVMTNIFENLFLIYKYF